MIERTSLPVDDQHSIDLVTERMPDGGWAVVASVRHRTPTGETVVDLPVHETRYASQADAREAGEREARAWLARNLPDAA